MCGVVGPAAARLSIRAPDGARAAENRRRCLAAHRRLMPFSLDISALRRSALQSRCHI